MTFFARILGLCLLFLTPLSASAQNRSIIVLDGSGSMWGQIDGRTKLEIAREALAEVVGSLPADTEMGLMAYGHRNEGDCGDIELIVPPGTGTGPAISDAAANLSFIGKTPLTDAVRQAAAALRSAEEKATVILITDGIETCNADPCALGAELESTGVDFTAHVVGFGLTAEEGASVACLAENTGGVYIEASNASTLKDALQTTVAAEPVVEPAPVPEPEPEPAALAYNFAPQLLMKAGGEVITDAGQAWEVYLPGADGQRGDRVTTEYNQPQIMLDPGSYLLVAKLGLAEVEQELVVTADALAAPTVVLNAGTLIVHPRGSEGGPIEASAAVRITNAAGMDSTSYGDTTMVVPAGDIKLLIKVGEAVAEQSTEIAPGQTVEMDVVAGAGLAVVDGYYVDGMRMETTQHAVQIFNAKPALDGSRTNITTAYGPAQQFTLPPGDYVAVVEEGAAKSEVAFTVKTGERVDVPVVLNAGVLFVSAPGANSIEVFAAKKDIQGNRAQMSFEYTEELTLTAPGGDVVIIVTRGEGVQSEATATVIPGERTEVAVP
jgi:Ca-activated chloride channel homolog